MAGVIDRVRNNLVSVGGGMDKLDRTERGVELPFPAGSDNRYAPYGDLRDHVPQRRCTLHADVIEPTGP